MEPDFAKIEYFRNCVQAFSDNLVNWTFVIMLRVLLWIVLKLIMILLSLFLFGVDVEPEPGFESRPDRIMASTRYLKVTSCLLYGQGQPYKSNYVSRVKWTRISRVLDAAKATYYGMLGNTGCHHDCGPHGSCRCSVCVSGGNKNSCVPPNCPECSSDIYFYFLITKVVFFAIIVQLFCSTLQLVIVFKSKYQSELERTGCNCCLCYPQLLVPCVHSSLTHPSSNAGLWHRLCGVLPSSNAGLRHSRRSWKRWIFLGMSPLVHFIYCIICFSVLTALCLHWFEEPLKTVNSVLEEELNPSDHLMVTAVLETA